MSSEAQVLKRQLSEDYAELSLRVDPQHPWFEGHFPGTPVFPGVALLAWVVELGQEYFQLAQPKGPAGAVKFQAIVRPGAELDLQLRWSAEKQRLSYQYLMADKSVASGWLAY